MTLRPHIAAPSLASRGDANAVAIEGVTLGRCLGAMPTPFYCTSLSAVEARATAYVSALSKHFPRSAVHYALKANFAPEVVEAVRRGGAGVDIVSVGEWRAALAAGAKPAEICFAGVGKRREEWIEAIEAGLGYLNVEHTAELREVLDHLAGKKGEARDGPLKASAATCVSLRLNPCVELDTHPHLRTGALDSKFGMLHEQVMGFLAQSRSLYPTGAEGDARFRRWLSPIKGVHVHVGSQLQAGNVFGHVATRTARLAGELCRQGIGVSHFDLGGGLGVGPDGVPPGHEDIREHVEFLSEALRRALLEEMSQNASAERDWGTELERVSVALEPGRSIVASSTLLVTRVLYEKSNSPEIHFAYVDAGMNDFPRPAIYGATHPVEFLATADGLGVASRGGASAAAREGSWLQPYQVVGPVCESGDVLARKAPLPPLRPGDVLGFLEAGAYCRSMASHYNLRPLPGEVFVRGSEIVSLREPRWP
jgi:diaminopimelate decarboxylase